jgi:hypothetical protein
LRKWRKRIQIGENIWKDIDMINWETTIKYKSDKEDPPIPSCLKIIDPDFWKSFNIVVKEINWYS